mmetsp:Transcript_27239/g.63485  ORF Transcript_27239/g.63485 Transcript_27239/m.63485 type:complete len:368 (-) Transcript_27239:81-1184(-)
MGCALRTSTTSTTPVTPLKHETEVERIFDPTPQALREAASETHSRSITDEVEILKGPDCQHMKKEVSLESVRAPVQQDVTVCDIDDELQGDDARRKVLDAVNPDASIVQVLPHSHFAAHIPVGPAQRHGAVKVYFIRHAQSSRRNSGGAADGSPDLGLSNLGQEQAQRLGQWLEHQLRRLVPDKLLIVTSPMRQCLLTMMPAIEALKLPREACVCHGSAYEFGHAGMDVPPGASATEIEEAWPVRCVEFGDTGWDYRGVSPVETGPELLLRIRRLGTWLAEVAIPDLLRRQSSDTPVLVACMHETLLDLLIRMLVDGEKPWDYSREVKYRIQNSYVAELQWSGDGTVTLIRKSSGDHLRFAVQSVIS